MVGRPRPLDARRRASPTRCRTAPRSRPCSARSTSRARRCARMAEHLRGAGGHPAWVHGRILDLAGRPIAGAELDVWQNGENELYAVQDPEARRKTTCAAASTRATDGRYAFLGVRPVPYPIPARRARRADAGRHRPPPWRPAHVHLIVRAPATAALTTHLFDADSPTSTPTPSSRSSRRSCGRSCRTPPDDRHAGGRRRRLVLGRERHRARARRT